MNPSEGVPKERMEDAPQRNGEAEVTKFGRQDPSAAEYSVIDVNRLGERLKGRDSLNLEPEEAGQFLRESGVFPMWRESEPLPICEFDHMKSLVEKAWSAWREAKTPEGEPPLPASITITEGMDQSSIMIYTAPYVSVELIFGKLFEHDGSGEPYLHEERCTLHFDLNGIVGRHDAGTVRTLRLIESVVNADEWARNAVDYLFAPLDKDSPSGVARPQPPPEIGH